MGVVERLRRWCGAGTGPRRLGWAGRSGEREAARTLRAKGYRILGRNVNVGWGEADLLCEAPDGDAIVLVEVKSRRAGEGGPFASPETSVGVRKRRKLVALLGALARANGWEDRPKRIDIVAVEWDERGAARVRHHEGAVGADGRLR